MPYIATMTPDGAPPTPARSDTGQASSRTPARLLFPVLVPLLVGLLHQLNLMHVARSLGCDPLSLACPAGKVPWVAPDTSSYVDVARDILAHGPLRASYLLRGPGYPLLLALSHRLAGHPLLPLWIEPWLAALAAGAVMSIARSIGAGGRGGAIAGLLFAAWPAMVQFAPELITDAPHAFLAALALAATLAWRERGGALLATAAALAWAACQSIRPTFFFIPALLPLLIARPRRAAASRAQAWGLWAATLAIPAFVVGSNLVQHGVATASAIGTETASCYLVPRVRAANGEGDFFAIREAAFARYRAIPLPERIAVQRADVRETIAAHPGLTLLSLGRELRQQLLSPPRPFSRYAWQALYPRWMTLAPAVNAIFWLGALLGLTCLLRADARVALFLVASFAGVMIPAATSALIENRLRLPMDVWAVPLVALAAGAALRARRRGWHN